MFMCAMVLSFQGQKAPSAKRCIKTILYHFLTLPQTSESESTQRQKVH